VRRAAGARRPPPARSCASSRAPAASSAGSRLVREGTIDPLDLERFVVTDSPAEAVESVTEVAMRRFGLTYGPRLRPRWYLGETD